ncbi:MAG: hypothetical protein AAB362_03270 [Patescibacteria group bacterium]
MLKCAFGIGLLALIFLMNASSVFAKPLKCEEVFGHSSLYSEIIFYDAGSGICIGDAADQYEYGEGRKNYSIENVFLKAPDGTTFIILAGFLREVDGKNVLVPNAFLLQKQQNGGMRGWRFFIPEGMSTPVRKFLQNITVMDINYAFRERLVVVFAHAPWISENASEAELYTILKPYMKYISETANIECEDGEEQEHLNGEETT